MTRAQIRTAVKERGYAGSNDSTITEAIASAYRRILGMYRWSFLRASIVITPVNVGVSSITISSAIADFGHLIAVHLTYGGNTYPLTWLPYEEFISERRNLSASTFESGEFGYWTRSGDQLLFDLATDRVVDVTVFYTKRHELDDDADEPLFSALYHDVLVWAALKDIAYRERDWIAYDRASTEYSTIMQSMVGEYGVEQNQAAREVGRSGFYDSI